MTSDWWHSLAWVFQVNHLHVRSMIININIYYMALSHKDWELPNSFPSRPASRSVMFWSEKVDCFHLTISISVSGKKLMRKKVKRTSKIWKNESRLVIVRKQNVSWYKPVTLNKFKYSCFCHIINILLTELSRSVWENLDLGRVYKPHCIRSVLTTLVKILPYRPPARLIRGKYS